MYLSNKKFNITTNLLNPNPKTILIMETVISPLTKIGRFLLAIPMAIFGIFHFMGAEGMAKMVPVPGGVIWVYVTGVALIAAAAAIIMQKKARLAAALLAILLLVFVLIIHLVTEYRGVV